MEGILLHVLYRGEKARDFAEEMEQSGLRAAVLAEEGCMQCCVPGKRRCTFPKRKKRHWQRLARTKTKQRCEKGWRFPAETPSFMI